jgi:transposase
MITADYSVKKVFVGIDYHQDGIQVCVMDAAGETLANRQVDNDWRSVEAVASRCGHVHRVAVEACSGAADLAEELVQRAGWCVELAHPGYVARMKGSPDKTDFTDSRLLADLTRVGYLPRVWLAPAAVREMRRLVRYRQQQVNAGRNAKLRIRALLRDHRLRSPAGVTAWSRGWWSWLEESAMPAVPSASRWIIRRHVRQLKFFKEEIAAAERQLRRFTKSDALVAGLLSEAGVGEVTAWVLRAEIGWFDRFDSGKSLARFCGLSPRNASSGARQADAGLIRAGSNLIRATLIELAHRLCMWVPRWRDLRLRLMQSGKPGSVAAAAVANRWIRGLYYRMRGYDALVS